MQHKARHGGGDISILVGSGITIGTNPQSETSCCRSKPVFATPSITPHDIAFYESVVAVGAAVGRRLNPFLRECDLVFGDKRFAAFRARICRAPRQVVHVACSKTNRLPLVFGKWILFVLCMCFRERKHHAHYEHQ